MNSVATLIGKFVLASLIFPFVLIIVAAVGLIMSVFVMLAWNAVMPAIFHFAEIGYWQAFALYMLAYLILPIKQINIK